MFNSLYLILKIQGEKNGKNIREKAIVNTQFYLFFGVEIASFFGLETISISRFTCQIKVYFLHKLTCVLDKFQF